MRLHVKAVIVPALAGWVLAVACGPAIVASHDGADRFRHLTPAERTDAIRRASVWMPTDIPSMDLRAGPQRKGAYAPNANVSCNYVDEKPSGASAKFICEVAPGDQVKVKYGENNVETYAEVAATRLLWALGFGADAWYPVVVECHGCPADPHVNRTPAATGTVTFNQAAIERKMPGKTMESKPDQGWRFSELDLVNDATAPAERAERDALRLLAVFLQHTDSKPQQQRLICLPGDSGGDGGAEESTNCARPFMMIHDLGLTFGRANLMNANQASGANYKRWASVPIWKDRAGCVGKLSGSFTGTMEDPVISEAGRKFLADLLAQLSDAQILDMFDVAHFGDRSDLELWVKTFKDKRSEIQSVTCPR